MYCTALRRASSRPAASLRVLSQRSSSQALQAVPRSAPRRFASTSPPADKSRSWKETLFRYGLAGGVVYFYFTSPIFADEGLFESPNDNFSGTPPSSFHEASDDDESAQQPLPTVQSIVEERKLAAESGKKPSRSGAETAAGAAADDDDDDSSAEDADGDAGQQAAFNPETGEINWDCPCLGGMAHGPCGQEFKAAFSCFVYSTEEPKGMECIDKFQGMQDCFRKHPDVYGAELGEADDEEQPETPPDADESAARVDQTTTTTTPDEAHQSTTTTEKSQTATKDQAVDEKKQDRPNNEPSRKDEAPSSPSSPSAATSEQKDKREKKTKETGPKAAAAESLTTPTSTSASPGPKWEDATGANVESQAKPADKQERQ